MSDMEEFFGPPISVYTREQAIEDGVLVDLTEWAKETGFKFPVAITSAAWTEAIGIHGSSTTGQCERGRAHDVLMMLLFVIKATHGGSDRVYFKVTVDGGPGPKRVVNMYAVVGPGDSGEPVITIMLVGED